MTSFTNTGEAETKSNLSLDSCSMKSLVIWKSLLRIEGFLPLNLCSYSLNLKKASEAKRRSALDVVLPVPERPKQSKFSGVLIIKSCSSVSLNLIFGIDLMKRSSSCVPSSSLTYSRISCYTCLCSKCFSIVIASPSVPKLDLISAGWIHSPYFFTISLLKFGVMIPSSKTYGRILTCFLSLLLSTVTIFSSVKKACLRSYSNGTYLKTRSGRKQ